MKITPNAIFTRVKSAVLEQFPTANCTQTYSPTPTKFPTVFARQIGQYTPMSTAVLDNTQDTASLTWEVQIFTNLQSGAKEQAYEILNVVKQSFQQMYFMLYSEVPIDTTTNYYALAARFRRQIGGGEEMP